MPSWQYILDENNNVIPTKDYDLVKEFLMSDKKIVRQTTIRDFFVSTVLLCIDHDWSYDRQVIRWNKSKPNPNPIVFETMIRNEKENIWLAYQERYRTYKQALEGHKCAIRFVIKEIRDKENK